MSSGPLILVIEHDPATARSVGALLRDQGYRVEEARTAGDAYQALCAEHLLPAAAILDLRMPGETGLELLARLPRPLPAPIVVLAGEATSGEVMEALRLGATDFVEKPPTPERIFAAVRNALQIHELQQERERLLAALARPSHLVGASPAVQRLRETIAQVARTDVLVLVTGETGSGKVRVARALHQASGRKGRLVTMSCGSVPAPLLESELFGYERGAFSGATSRHLGRFEQAQHGTLLLDGIADLPLDTQARLLRVLETREVERLGGQAPVKLNVRVIATANEDLEVLVKAGRFRQDLFFRVSLLPIRVPPLRERPEDLLPLIRAFAAELAGPNVEVVLEDEAALRRYPWPGNVRELRNLVERLAMLRKDGPLRISAPAWPGVRAAD